MTVRADGERLSQFSGFLLAERPWHLGPSAFILPSDLVIKTRCANITQILPFNELLLAIYIGERGWNRGRIVERVVDGSRCPVLPNTTRRPPRQQHPRVKTSSDTFFRRRSEARKAFLQNSPKTEVLLPEILTSACRILVSHDLYTLPATYIKLSLGKMLYKEQ